MKERKDIKFLVVDDSSTMRRIVKASLAKFGFTNAQEAGDGREGVEKAKNDLFDCILTDWNMPNIDGITMLREVRALPGYEKVPVIMVTTEQTKEDVIDALKQGINAYIVKPFTPQTLNDKIEGVLQSLLKSG